MSRIPASPQMTNAPAPLPAVKAPGSSQIVDQLSVVKASNPSDQIVLEKNGGSMSHYNLGLDAATATDPVTEPVTEPEIQWALALEEKVVKGYQPTSKEFEKYADISARLSDCNPARQMGDSEVTETPHLQQVEPDATTDAELKWALRLEERVKQGYQPTAEEVTAYEKIYTQLAAQKSVRSEIPAEDMKWAKGLMEKVGKGYQPNAQEMKRYDAIYAQAQQDIQAQQPSPEEKAVEWAKDLQVKVAQGYQPSDSEVKRYTEIYERLQQGIQ